MPPSSTFPRTSPKTPQSRHPPRRGKHIGKQVSAARHRALETLSTRKSRATREYVSSARNITLTLDEETLREARVLAAQRGLSVSAFLRSELAGLVERQRGYSRARDAAIRR